MRWRRRADTGESGKFFQSAVYACAAGISCVCIRAAQMEEYYGFKSKGI